MGGAANTGQPARWRLALSDGTHWGSVMLATQLNDLMAANPIDRGHIVRLNEFIVNNISNKK